jgi:hypothetical protein
VTYCQLIDEQNAEEVAASVPENSACGVAAPEASECGQRSKLNPVFPILQQLTPKALLRSHADAMTEPWAME